MERKIIEHDSYKRVYSRIEKKYNCTIQETDRYTVKKSDNFANENLFEYKQQLLNRGKDITLSYLNYNDCYHVSRSDNLCYLRISNADTEIQVLEITWTLEQIKEYIEKEEKNLSYITNSLNKAFEIVNDKQLETIFRNRSAQYLITTIFEDIIKEKELKDILIDYQIIDYLRKEKYHYSSNDLRQEIENISMKVVISKKESNDIITCNEIDINRNFFMLASNTEQREYNSIRFILAQWLCYCNSTESNEDICRKHLMPENRALFESFINTNIKQYQMLDGYWRLQRGFGYYLDKQNKKGQVCYYHNKLDEQKATKYTEYIGKHIGFHKGLDDIYSNELYSVFAIQYDKETIAELTHYEINNEEQFKRSFSFYVDFVYRLFSDEIYDDIEEREILTGDEHDYCNVINGNFFVDLSNYFDNTIIKEVIGHDSKWWLNCLRNDSEINGQGVANYDLTYYYYRTYYDDINHQLFIVIPKLNMDTYDKIYRQNDLLEI